MTGGLQDHEMLASGMARMRAVRGAIESEVVSIGSSADERAFTMQYSVTGPAASPGSYVAFEPPGRPVLLGATMSR